MFEHQWLLHMHMASYFRTSSRLEMYDGRTTNSVAVNNNVQQWFSYHLSLCRSMIALYR